jgi:hypothetical protein
MDCLFCGATMVDGWVAVSGVYRLGTWDAGLTWEPAEIRTMKKRWRDLGKRGEVTLLTNGFFRRRERPAALCYECGAVVIAPLEATTDATAESAAEEPRSDSSDDN